MRLNQAELAEAFGVTTRTVRTWTEQGMPVSAQGNYRKYELKECVAWRIRTEVERMTGGGVEVTVPGRSATTNLRVSQARVAALKAEMMEDELRTARSELIPADQVLQRIREPLEAVDAQLRTAARRHSREWAERLGVSRAEAMAMLHDLSEELRADLRRVFEEGDGDGGGADT